MDPVVAQIRRLGGVATATELAGQFTKRQLRATVEAGLVLRPRRGRYVLPEAETARGVAHELSAVVSHRSAALAHGWRVKSIPPLPEITVPGGRKITAAARARARIHSAPLAEQDAASGLTSPLRTVIDCARALPLDEALAIADSALRHRAVRPSDLSRAMAEVKGPGRPKVLRVLEHASGRAANPFESVLRATSLDVPGLHLRPQVGIVVAGQRVVPDLVDVDLGLVAEADSHEFHTKRRQIATDCWRYDELVLGGWRVFRFAYEQVMFEQGWVRSVLCRAAGSAPT